MSIPVQEIQDPTIAQYGVQLSILRLDQVHPFLSGNKWYKLKYNLEEMKSQGKNTLLTFGGAYSNHIAAVAAAGKEKNIKTIGVIRGEELKGDNPTLLFARECGMQLHFISREDYRKKKQEDFIKSLHAKFGDFYLLPEGGSNFLAVKGCSEILQQAPDFDFVVCAVGTGATIAGLTRSLKQKQQALGIAVLSNANFLEQDIEAFLAGDSSPDQSKEPALSLSKGETIYRWKLLHDYHFGRYARTTDELTTFIERFISATEIPLEPVYTGKMMYGIYDLLAKGFFTKGEKILAVHTGGNR